MKETLTMSKYKIIECLTHRCPRRQKLQFVTACKDIVVTMTNSIISFCRRRWSYINFMIYRLHLAAWKSIQYVRLLEFQMT